MRQQFRDILDADGEELIDPRWGGISPERFADIITEALEPGGSPRLHDWARNSAQAGGLRITWGGIEWTPAAQLGLYEQALRRQRAAQPARGFKKIPPAVLERPDLTASAQKVLRALVGAAGDEQTIAIAVWRLARRCRLAEKTTKRQLRVLEDLGLISRLYCSPGGVSNTYRLNFLNPSRPRDDQARAPASPSSATPPRDDRQGELAL